MIFQGAGHADKWQTGILMRTDMKNISALYLQFLE